MVEIPSQLSTNYIPDSVSYLQHDNSNYGIKLAGYRHSGDFNPLEFYLGFMQLHPDLIVRKAMSERLLLFVMWFQGEAGYLSHELFNGLD